LYSVQTYVGVCLILFLAGFTHGFSGFGAVLISIPLLALLLDVKTLIPLTALAGFSMTAMLLIQLRDRLEWKKIFPLFWGTIPGIPVGVFFLKRLDEGTIHWVLGILLIAHALYGLISRSAMRGIGNRWGYVFGFFAGCLGGALSASGPAVIAYMSLTDWDKDQIKVTLQGFFISSGLIVILFHALSGLTNLTVLALYGAALPGLVSGTYLGSLFYGKIGEEQYRSVMLALILFLGAFMIYRA
jgi:uncharacterized membrane protein YfcA